MQKAKSVGADFAFCAGTLFLQRRIVNYSNGECGEYS